MLSILIPVRNESDNLKGLINYYSNKLQHINYEALIINDFSDDDTLEKANSLSYENKKFKVLNNKKKGLGGAVNLGIKDAFCPQAKIRGGRLRPKTTSVMSTSRPSK